MAQGILLASRMGALRPFDLVPRSQHLSVGAFNRKTLLSHIGLGKTTASRAGHPLPVQLFGPLLKLQNLEGKAMSRGHKYAQIIGKYGHHVVISDWIDSDRHVCRVPISVSI